ncbi:MAG TPA: hypothetical protein VFC51_16865 [Chloroflexota bacterium]|nr:hypothetical protein [Chloroflexota bacterium]
MSRIRTRISALASAVASAPGAPATDAPLVGDRAGENAARRLTLGGAPRFDLIVGPEHARRVVLAVGAATFICGFFVGALLSAVLIAIHHPLVSELRSSLNYESAIFGDGLVLPIVNMAAATAILRHQRLVTPGAVQIAFFIGAAVTAAFHIDQAVHGIVNWTMPEPWHWNALGAWHAAYMLAVASWLSLFLVVVVRSAVRHRTVTRETAIVLLGVIVFFALLRLDYLSLDIGTLFPGR